MNTFYEAKSDTLSQVTKSADSADYCTAAQTFIGYQVVVNNSVVPNTYSLQVGCSDAGGKHFTNIYTRSVPSSIGISLSKVTIDSSGNTQLTPSPLLFSPPDASPDASYAAYIRGTQTVKISIDAQGVIRQ